MWHAVRPSIGLRISSCSGTKLISSGRSNESGAYASSGSVAVRLRRYELVGINYQEVPARKYPASDMAAHLFGFEWHQALRRAGAAAEA